MLSTFARGAVQRLPLRTVATSPVVSRLASRAATTQPGLLAVLVSNTSSSGALRSFATKAEATKDAKKPAKKTTTTTKASSTKPKKAAAKPKPKPKPKKKVVAKKKPVVKKKAVRKELTPEQKERKELQKARLEKQTLKVAALYAEEPKNELPTSGYRVFLAQELKGAHGNNTDRFATVAASWKSLSSSEVQRLNQVAEENKLKNQAKHLAWLESRTPEEIHQANQARHLLKRKYNYPKATKQVLKDERQPARIRTAYIYFTKARWASGEFANKPITEVAAALSAEWKKMTESEKAPYHELQEADKVRLERESPVSQ